MPYKGTTKLTPQQKENVALAKALGKTHKEAAAAASVSEASVDRIVADPKTQTLIQQFRAKHADKLAQLYERSLVTAMSDLDAEDGKTRCATREFVLRACQAGDPKGGVIAIGDGESQGEYTLEELMVTFRRATMTGHIKS